jgi:hypothetical protein
VRPGELTPGERLKTDGGEVVVDRVRWLRKPAQVYNLEVAGDHYYLVSEARVLSHNADGCGGIGFTEDTVDSALATNIRGNGHQLKHLRDEGLIPNTGSPQSQLDAFNSKVRPILRAPEHTAAWRIGNTNARAFLGEIDNTRVAVIVATDGPKQGKVLTAIVPDANQLQIMMSR